MSIKVTDATYEDFTSSGIALVDFSAEWCGPCRQIGPIVEELSNEYDNVKIGKLDADENKETLQNLGIRGIPTILIYKDGTVVEKHVGMASKSQLKELIDKHLN